MKSFLLLVSLILSGFVLSQNISGKVTSEDDVLIPRVLIVNMTSNEKAYSDPQGNFTINAKMGDEIRFAKERYKLAKIVINNFENQTVKLEKIPQEIEEVKLISKSISHSQEEQLRQSIGLPKSPEKPREKPVGAREVLMPLLGASLNIDNLYKWLSGKSRRLKRLYKYEDMQEGLAWMRNNIDYQYFADAGINKEKINDFLTYCLRDEKVLMYMKAKNLGGITVELDNHIDSYLQVLSNNQK